MSAVPTKVEEGNQKIDLSAIYDKVRKGDLIFSTEEFEKLFKIPDTELPANVRNILRENVSAKEEEKKVEEETPTKENVHPVNIKNDSTVTIVDIANPPPFIKIGKHVFTTNEDKLSGKQSQTNFDLNGVGSVYAELKNIYGVHPKETPHKYNLLLHNFGVYHKDDQPLFEQGSCVPRKKDVVKQILDLGLAHLQAKKNSTRNRPLTNIGKVDAQIVELKRLLEKLKTMGESPVCDITQGAPQPPAVVPTVGKPGPVPNCLQDTKMLQSFLNMLTLMMGIMSDDDKRKNLKAVNLKDILAIGTKDPKNVTDANRQVVSEKIEALLKILQNVSTTDVNASPDIEDFLEALKKDEELQKVTSSPFPGTLNEVLPFFKNILHESNEFHEYYFRLNIEQFESTIENYKNEIQQLTGVTGEQRSKLDILFSYIDKLITELKVDGNENDEIMRNALQKIQDLSKISAASPELQKTIEKMKEETQKLKQELEESRMEKEDLGTKHTADITQIQGELKTATEKVAKAEAEHAAAIAQHEAASKAALESKVAEFAAERQSVQEQTEQAARQASEKLEEKKAELEKAQQEQAKLQGELATAQAQTLQVRDQLKISEEEKVQISTRVATLQKNLESIGAQLKTMTSAHNTAQGSLTTRTQELKDTQDALETAQAATQAVQKLLDDTVFQFSTLKISFGELQNANERLQTQLKALQTEKESELAQYTTTLQQLKQAHADAIQNLTKEHAAAIQHHKGIEQDERIKSEKLTEQLNQQASAHSQAIADKNKANEILQKQFNELQSQITSLPTQATLNEKTAKITELETQIKQNKETIDELTRKVAENESLQENLTAEKAEKTRLQGELATLQQTSNGNQDTIARLQDEIRQRDARIREYESQAQELTAVHSQIAQLQTTLTAAQTEKTEIEQKLDAFTAQAAAATAEQKQKFEEEMAELVTELTKKETTIAALTAELESLRQANTTKDTEIGQLTAQLTELQTKAKSATKKEDIETRLNTILPYLLVNDDLTNKIKTFMSTGVMDPTLQSSLEEHKSTMCMIFQTAYALIQYNNTFINNIAYGFGGGTIYSQLNSTSSPLYFYTKTDKTTRITYKDDEEIQLLKDIVSLFSIIFIEKDNTKVQYQGDFPILFDMLSKKSKTYLGDKKEGAGNPRTQDEDVYNAFDKLFPRNIYGGIYIENTFSIYYSRKTEKSFKPGNTTGGFLSHASYTRISVLLIMLTQLINKHITPKLETFISNCGKKMSSNSIKKLSGTIIQRLPSVPTVVTGDTAKVQPQSLKAGTSQKPPFSPATGAQLLSPLTGRKTHGGDASDLIAFDEE